MSDIYTQLRDKLNQMGFGYAPTETGVEFTFLKRFFSPEDAAYYLAMDDGYQTPAEAAARMGKDVSDVSVKLEDMSKRGLIFRIRNNNEVKYRPVPVAHGIYEFNVNHIEPEWTRDFAKHYIQGFGSQFYGTDTPVFRALPIKAVVVAGSKVLPFDDAEAILRSKKDIALAKCMCRTREAERGKPCGHPLETCLIFDDFAKYYVENGIGRMINLDDALEIIKAGEKDGRVVQVSNSMDVEVMCSCCACGCGLLGAMKYFPGPAKDAVSNYFCQRDETLCKKKCAKICTSRCPMGAIQAVDGDSQIDRKKCIGCGLCVTTCPNKALSLIRKTEEEIYQPPATLFDAYGDMQKYRK
jgi:electron transport complex protein RnfB